MKLAAAYRLTGLLALLLLSACSQTSLLTKQDYQKSQSQFIQGNTDDALLSFPRQAEAENFITTMEKSYLNLVQGKAQLKSLQQQVEVLENRVRYHVSREAKTFFYLQTPEDYYASEHEVIWLHMLLSWGYSLQGKYENACVEARVASSLLSLPWSPVGHFDDPAMRLFLAGLWAMCGDWQEARVDFRAAWKLDSSLGWARQLADREQAPANLFLILGGPGPQAEWTPETKLNPVRSNRQITFKLRGRKSSISITDRSGQVIYPSISPDATNWYARHLERESELHELILDSAFGGKATAHGALAGAKIAVTTTYGVAVGILGTAVGLYVAQAGPNAVEAGLSIVAISLIYADKVISDGYKSSVKEFKQELDPSKNYRYVRYLPEYLWVGWSDQPVSYPVEIRSSSGSRTLIQQPVVIGPSSVTLGFLPDANISFGYLRRY